MGGGVKMEETEIENEKEREGGREEGEEERKKVRYEVKATARRCVSSRLQRLKSQYARVLVTIVVDVVVSQRPRSSPPLIAREMIPVTTNDTSNK